jgi:hypothetical protein
MHIAKGQRWHYKDTTGFYIGEITEVRRDNSVSVKILQATTGIFRKVGDIYSSDGLSYLLKNYNVSYWKDFWTYLPGQDATQSA